MPRSFSSWRRSGSMPVSARISVDLPWSTWPAVPMTRIRTSRAARRLLPSSGVLLGQDRAQVEQHRSSSMRPMTGGSACRKRPPGDRAIGVSSATAQLGWVWPGSEPPPIGRARCHDARALELCGQRSRARPRGLGRRRRSCARRAPRVRPRRARSAPASRRAPPASACRVGSRASADAAAACRSRSARPTMMPACGPPSSLSPEKPPASCPRPRWPGPSARGPARSAPYPASEPEPRSSTTGRPCARADLDQLLERRLVDEADLQEIRGVHAQQQRGRGR